MTKNQFLRSASPQTTTLKPQISSSSTDSYQLAVTAAQAADDRKAGDIALLKVADVSYLADYFVIASGFSRVQLRAIAEAIQEQVQKTLDRRPVRSEGLKDGSWVLLDYGDVIVHILLPSEREFYNLEAFWGHAERLHFQPESRQT